MKLVALQCPTCASPLAAENDDMVVACNNCHNIIAISQDGPVKMAVRFMVPAGHQAPGGRWVPFWLFNGRVLIRRRDTQGGSGSAEKDSKQMWQSPRALYVPAWELSMQTAQNVGSRLIQQQPQLQEVQHSEEAIFTSATITPGDARKLLEFIILAIEARRKDWLRNLQFDLEVGEPQMIAMPQSMFGA